MYEIIDRKHQRQVFSRRGPYKARVREKMICCMKNTKTYIVDQFVLSGQSDQHLQLVIRFIKRFSTDSPECIVLQ